jgi:membrane dipeptidase
VYKRQDTLRALYEAGIRYVTLTHVSSHSWADASQDQPRWNGLSEKGRQLVREMNRLGMLIDLSHASDATFFEVLDITQAPVILSHSSMRALVPTVRNASDEMLRALAQNGGVVLINFFDALVNPNLTAEVYAEAERRTGGNLRRLWEAVYAIARERTLPRSTVEDVLNHIDHAVQVTGIDHVGLGSDFDGVFELPAGLEDVTRLPWITYGLYQRGYTATDIQKLLGGNLLRVLVEVEQVAARLRATEE